MSNTFRYRAVQVHYTQIRYSFTSSSIATSINITITITITIAPPPLSLDPSLFLPPLSLHLPPILPVCLLPSSFQVKAFLSDARPFKKLPMTRAGGGGGAGGEGGLVGIDRRPASAPSHTGGGGRSGYCHGHGYDGVDSIVGGVCGTKGSAGGTGNGLAQRVRGGGGAAHGRELFTGEGSRRRPGTAGAVIGEGSQRGWDNGDPSKWRGAGDQVRAM